MRTTKPLGAAALLLSLTAIGYAQSSAVTVKVGSNAPALTVKKWIKGAPVASLGHGKVNVVEFWATWCGPCKTSIPHLTELAHKYKGKATFTGVSVFEVPNAKDESYMTKVSNFVKEMGAKMDYNVAADGMDAPMANHWMIAAGQDGIPTAFVVNQEGKIAWIGHPMAGLDEAVQKVIDGKMDVQAEAAKQAEENEKKAKEKAAMQKFNEEAGPFITALRAKKYAEAVPELDKLIAKHPEMELQLSMTRFSILGQYDEPAAFAYGKQLSTGKLKDNGDALNSIAWQMVDDKTKFKHPDFAIAAFIARRSAEANKMADPMSLDTYAYALFKNGQTKEAFDVETKAVDLAEKQKDRIDAATLKELKDRLETFKSKISK